MKNLRKALMIFSVGVMTFANAALAGGKGTSGGQFLRVGAGARGPAMGGAFSPVVDDATAIYWNPAGLANVEKRDLQLSYNAYFEDTASQFLGYAHPSSRGVFGIGVSMFGVDDIQKRSATGGDADLPDLGNFDTRDMALALGWADRREMTKGLLNYGASIKYISSDLESEKAATGALDLGVSYQCEKDAGLVASLAVLNLGGSLKYAKEGDSLPLDIKPGLGWRQDMNRLGRLTLALDADILLKDDEILVQPGLEWWPHRVVALRGGYQFGRDDGAGDGLGVGAGFRIFSIGVDYAFVPFGDLGDTHRLSLGLRF